MGDAGTGVMLPSMFGPNRPPGGGMTNHLPAEAVENLLETYKEQSFDVVRGEVTLKVDLATSQGKVPFVKDHTFYITRPDVVRFEMLKGVPNATPQEVLSVPGHSNPLIYSDEFMDTITPILTIRHPARMLPSCYGLTSKAVGGKVTDPGWNVITSYKWLRILFDWYVKRAAELGSESKVIIIDGDEFINNSEGIVDQFCRMTGVDPSGVQFSWEAGEINLESEDRPAEWGPMDALAEGSLRKSTHIEKNPALLKDPDIATEAKKWSVEFGEDISKAIVLAIDRTMEDYNYLKKFSLKGHVS